MHSYDVYFMFIILDSSGSDTFEPPIQGKRIEKRNAHTAAEQKRRDTIKVIHFAYFTYFYLICSLQSGNIVVFLSLYLFCTLL